MRRRDAVDILREHVVERRLRYGIKAQDISGDPNAQARMSQGQWVDSCALCAGVDHETLRLLDARFCAQVGTTWATQLVELQGGEVEVRKEQVALTPSWRQAAELSGLAITAAEARAMYGAAVESVQDRLLRRVANEQQEAA